MTTDGIQAFTGLTRNDRKYIGGGRSEQVLPENPGVSHAVVLYDSYPLRRYSPIGAFRRRSDDLVKVLKKTREAQFSDAKWSDWDAACGRKIRVVLPTQFRDDDPDACQGCVAKVYELSQAT